MLLFPNSTQGIFGASRRHHLIVPRQAAFSFLYLELCRSMARGLLSDLFQKCVSHAQWESWLWRWTRVESTAVVTPEHVPQVFWYSRAWLVLIQWKEKTRLHIMCVHFHISAVVFDVTLLVQSVIQPPHTHLTHFKRNYLGRQWRLLHWANLSYNPTTG